MDTLSRRIFEITGTPPVSFEALSGGCVGEVRRAVLEGGGSVVVKTGGGLEVEGWMLRTLAARSALPVPAVLHADDSLLVMEYIEAGDPITPAAETHAAELLAELHGMSAPGFGLERDTVIGGLRQPNDPCGDWIEFFRDRRLMHMARAAFDAGRLPAESMGRVERLAARLDEWLEAPEQPALIHGDMWGGNVLVKDGRIAGFVDPAVYYADAEVELAFSTLFSTFGEPFFKRYREIRPLEPGFPEVRRDLYNLYPLLVHVRLFGDGYLASVERTLSRYGV